VWSLFNDENQDVYGFLDPYYINPIGKKSETQPSHTSLTLWKKRENKFIFAFILMSKFNYKLLIITISCFKYLLTLFMNDIWIIDSYFLSTVDKTVV